MAECEACASELTTAAFECRECGTVTCRSHRAPDEHDCQAGPHAVPDYRILDPETVAAGDGREYSTTVDRMSTLADLEGEFGERVLEAFERRTGRVPGEEVYLAITVRRPPVDAGLWMCSQHCVASYGKKCRMNKQSVVEEILILNYAVKNGSITRRHVRLQV